VKDGSHKPIVIIGGGLAGLCLAVQIKRAHPLSRVTVLERKGFPHPEATHKVGESTVELAAHYFSEVLGLKAHLQNDQLRKLGLRLFFTAGKNDRIEERLEMGSDRHFSVPTYQIDRGRFENYLAELVRELGVSLLENCKVSSVQLSSNGSDHAISYVQHDVAHSLSAAWVIDASGRAGVLKRLLNAQTPSEHDSNAAWFRVKARVDIDDWSSQPGWRDGHDGIHSRWYSTNHLTGNGYWVWLIPLASGYTSVGIVTDPKLHPLSRFRSFEETLSWLKEFEPQCAERLAAHAGDVADFLAIKHYAHKCQRVLSGDRWAITGDAGVFIDPLYSPGSDFIAIQNTFITDLISRDFAGQRFVGRCEAYNDIYHELSESFLKTFLGQYPVFGNPRIMPLKVIWDYTIYWGFLAFVSIQQRFCDFESLSAIHEAVMEIYARGEQMQKIFRDNNERSREPVSPGMLDIARIPFLFELNRSMTVARSQEDFLATLQVNIELIEEVFQKIKGIVESPRCVWNSAAELIELFADITLRLSPTDTSRNEAATTSCAAA
jgi:flavin-dependent dehydrogenase